MGFELIGKGGKERVLGDFSVLARVLGLVLIGLLGMLKGVGGIRRR